MSAAILVLNAGSSSIKFSVFVARGADLELDCRGQIEGINTAPHFVAKDGGGTIIAERSWSNDASRGHDGALDQLRSFLREELKDLPLAGVGHRVVHGGLKYAAPVRVDERVVEALQEFIPLAPLHQPHNLTPIRLLLERMPSVPQVACFDTAFHRSNPDIAQRFALPAELHDSGVRRYGFHGLSYEYIASVLPQFDAAAAAGRTIVLHLGNGASMCAFAGSASIASTMGFTAVDGLPMGTRCGSIDPGVILYLLSERNVSLTEVEDLIYKRSGLLGVSGISSDMRTLLASDAATAALAVDLYVYRIGRELGSLAAALGGLDAMVFTAGIGENSAVIRERVCRGAAWLGVEFDPIANASGGPRISTTNSRVTALVIPTNEELMIARHTLRLLGDSAARSTNQPARTYQP